MRTVLSPKQALNVPMWFCVHVTKIKGAMYLRYKPRPDGIWERWRFDFVAEGEEQVVEERPWWERHNITLPRTIYKLKEIATLDEEAVSQH